MSESPIIQLQSADYRLCICFDHIGGTAENNCSEEKEFWDVIHEAFHHTAFPILS